MMNRAVLLVLCLALSSCGKGPPTNPTLPAGGLSMSWVRPPDKENPVPGIDEGTVERVGGMVGFWGDSPGGCGANTQSGPNGLKAEGYLRMRGGQSVTFRVETKDGKTGPVMLDGKTYELAKGNLFLV